MSSVGSRSGRRAYKVGCVDLNFVAPFRLHLSQCELGIFQQNAVLDISETNRNSGGVCYSVCANANEIRWEGASSCAKDELERVLSIEFKTRQFCRAVGKRRGDSGESLAISVDVK